MKSQAAKQAKPVRQNSNTPSSAARPAHDASGLADQRPDALAQAQLLGLINGSAQVMQQKALGESINNSSRMVAQRQAHDAMFGAVAQREAQAAPPPNQTGLPDNLKAGVEALSGISLDHVRVHYNSPQPAQLNAHAYAQGSEIHVAPGQAHHLPHEAWHVVQQAQGRVQATTQMKGGVAVNDDKGLETEADVMGARALQLKSKASGADHALPQTPGSSCAIVQRVPTALTAAAFDNGVPAYTPGAFATVYASVSTTRNNHNGGSAPADPINANRIRSGHWQGEDYQLAMGAGPGQQTIAWVQGGISAGGAGNQLTRVHIIHHGLGAGTNNNPSNIFWGNPGFNNPQILVEETRMLNHLAAGGRPNLFNGGVTLTNDYYGVAGNNNVVPYMGQWYANANATIPALSPALAPASAAAVAVNNAFGTAGQPICQVIPNQVPHTGEYAMTVNYGANGMGAGAMFAALYGTIQHTYLNGRAGASWGGENDAAVQTELGAIANEASQSISVSVTILQNHNAMQWNSPVGLPVAPVAIQNATQWVNLATFNNPVNDNARPRYRTTLNYQTAGGRADTPHLLSNW